MKMSTRAGLKHLVSDTAAFITAGGIIMGAIWYLADIPKQVEAHGKRLNAIETAIPLELREIRESQIRTEERVEWLVRERKQAKQR